LCIAPVGPSRHSHSVCCAAAENVSALEIVEQFGRCSGALDASDDRSIAAANEKHLGPLGLAVLLDRKQQARFCVSIAGEF